MDTTKRNPLDGYQGQILGAAALTLLKMGWTVPEIHQMIDMTFEMDAKLEADPALVDRFAEALGPFLRPQS